MDSDKKIEFRALGITFLIHFLVLIIPIKQQIENVKNAPMPKPIPITYIEKKIIVQKKKPKPPIKKKLPVKVKKPIKKATPPPPPPPPKPTSLPGDRKQAVVAHTQAPYYPKEAINNLLEGTTVLTVTIDAYGTVRSVELKRSSGHTSLDQAFIDTVKEYYTFKPKRIMGSNQSDIITLSYTFEL